MSCSYPYSLVSSVKAAATNVKVTSAKQNPRPCGISELQLGFLFSREDTDN